MKKGYKSAIRIAGFLIILVIILVIINNIFKFKYYDGIYSVQKFYEQEENTVDVLILGSSHAFENINTGILWDDYGIASYVLAGAIQPTWNSYYYLKEALKTQKPKLIVFEGYMIAYQSDGYMEADNAIKNTYGMNISKNKFEAKDTSVPEDDFISSLLEYPQYHNRYKDIDEGDFLKDLGDKFYSSWKGYVCNTNICANDVLDVSYVDGRAELPEKEGYYYKKILELAKAEGIPMLVVVSPFGSIDEETQEVYNTAADIANEYGVEFVNYNTHPEEIEIDNATDYADRYHLNHHGNAKLTKAVGKLIKNRFDIPNRRDDEKYSSWEANARFLKADLLDYELKATYSVKDYLDKIDASENYIVFMSVNGDIDWSVIVGNEAIKDSGVMKNLLSENNWMYVDAGLYIIDNDVISERIADDEYLWENGYASIFYKTINGKDSLNYELFLNGKGANVFENAINLVVYDQYTEKVVDCVNIINTDLDNIYR